VTTDANGGDQGGAPGSAPAPGADTTLTPGQPAASWYSSIDFGDAKESATAALSSFKTPQELVGALDWRKSVSGGDEKAVKTFERFATLGDLGKAYREAQAKISSGELAKPLPKDATPEQIKAYREGNGIPEKPEGYFEKLPNGLVIGEDDKPLFEGFAKSMHELNAPPAMIHKAVEWYYGMQDQQIQAQQAADAESKKAFESKLQEVWGGDFKPNANIYSNFIAGAPKEVQAALTTARDAEGNFLLYKPEVVSWLTNQAREINPAGHIVPGAGDTAISSIQTEIASIEGLMRTDRQAYNKDAAKQERLRQLYEARTKLQERGRAA
jgi:hypothetical protein